MPKSSVIKSFLAGAAMFMLSAGAALAQDIKIGHYGSLTGPQATFGLSTSNGVKLALKELNAAGGIAGRQVVLVEYDTKGDSKEAGTVVTRLTTSDKVAAVIGEVASKLSLVGAPICQEHSIPMVSPSSTNPRVTEVGDMIFRVCFIDPFQGFVCAKFARENLKVKRAAILIDQANTYSVGLAEQFEKHFKEMGGDIVIKQTYQEGEQDFNTRLTAIRAAAPEVIFVPGYYNDVANIAVTARKLGITVPLLGGDGWDSEDLAKNAGSAIEGSFYSNHASPDDPNMEGFVKKYEDEYGSTPDALAALGYDAANLVFAGLKQTNGASGPALRDAIRDIKGFAGVTGAIQFDENRNAIKPAVIVTIKDGKVAYVTTIKP
jgi:branched-chain amino acid transport system substrate-binding protein